MRIALDGQAALVLGGEGPFVRALVTALAGNGARVAPSDTIWREGGPVPDLLVACHELQIDAAPFDHPALVATTDRIGEAMAARGHGRIVIVTSALGVLPARRYPDTSAAAAAVVVAMRSLAMRVGPKVQVNAVGAGAIVEGETYVSGSAPMLTHVTAGGAGAIEDVVHAALFLADPANSYMTGQVLTVDGGWAAGYGRNF
jgi:NAD(P)-dependent dehydrogenase (short-subunit alcohol dehydrogenase family)